MCVVHLRPLLRVSGGGRGTRKPLWLVLKSSGAVGEWEEVCICGAGFYCVNSSNLLPTSRSDSALGWGPRLRRDPFKPGADCMGWSEDSAMCWYNRTL